jgi:hypothetical protein
MTRDFVEYTYTTEDLARILQVEVSTIQRASSRCSVNLHDLKSVLLFMARSGNPELRFEIITALSSSDGRKKSMKQQKLKTVKKPRPPRESA